MEFKVKKSVKKRKEFFKKQSYGQKKATNKLKMMKKMVKKRQKKQVKEYENKDLKTEMD